MNEIKIRQHGDITEHQHGEYDYWHPATRIHIGQRVEDIGTDEHIGGEFLHGMQPTRTFSWQEWDANCHAKGMCHSLQPASKMNYLLLDSPVIWNKWDTEYTFSPSQDMVKLHHRYADPFFNGIVKSYWQCIHCRPLQKWYRGATRNRLIGIQVDHRGDRELVFIETTGASFMFVMVGTNIANIAIVGEDYGEKWSFFILFGDHEPQVLPNEIGIILARRLLFKLTKGAWSDAPKEENY